MRVKNALGPNIHIQTFAPRMASTTVLLTRLQPSRIFIGHLSAPVPSAQGHVTAEPHAANLCLCNVLSDDDSPAWRRESQPPRDLRLKLTQRYNIVLV